MSGAKPPAGDDLVGRLRDVLPLIEESLCDNEKEATFVADIRARYEQYQDRTKVSAKQIKWLEEIRGRQARDEAPPFPPEQPQGGSAGWTRHIDDDDDIPFIVTYIEGHI